jgi:hypothetical protein
MKKALVLLPVVAVLTACGTFSSKDPYQKRADAIMEQRQKQVEKVQDKTPSWYHKTPVANQGAIYAVGTASSTNQWVALDNAKVLAKASICTSVNGTVSKKSKVYFRNTENDTVEVSELAIVERCEKTDVSGLDVSRQATAVINGRHYYWVEVAFPLGESNIIQSQRQRNKEREASIMGSKQLFNEVDSADQRKN